MPTLGHCNGSYSKTQPGLGSWRGLESLRCCYPQLTRTPVDTKRWQPGKRGEQWVGQRPAQLEVVGQRGSPGVVLCPSVSLLWDLCTHLPTLGGDSVHVDCI